jgi:hypothetical protein
MQLKAKKHSPLAATTRSNKEIRCRFSGKLWPCWYLDFGLQDFKIVREYISSVLSHPVCHAGKWRSMNLSLAIFTLMWGRIKLHLSVQRLIFLVPSLILKIKTLPFFVTCTQFSNIFPLLLQRSLKPMWWFYLLVLVSRVGFALHSHKDWSWFRTAR